MTDRDLTVSTMSAAWSPAVPIALERAPRDVHRVLGDLGRLLLAIPSYRVEPVIVEGEPLAAFRVERRDSNPVVIVVTVP